MNMIEKVARVIARLSLTGRGMEAFDNDLNYYINEFSDSEKEDFIDCAKAAIEAMREPTEGMIIACELNMFEWKDKAEDWTLQAAKEGYQAAIDAALKED